mmetsp:Transcript_15463/g.22709  ORF Transcript_15463/g.22709 Transcript_15463/m.22709 type:complete len:192 (-) Transcript_15463:135-710(-)
MERIADKGIRERLVAAGYRSIEDLPNVAVLDRWTAVQNDCSPKLSNAELNRILNILFPPLAGPQIPANSFQATTHPGREDSVESSGTRKRGISDLTHSTSDTIITNRRITVSECVKKFTVKTASKHHQNFGKSLSKRVDRLKYKGGVIDALDIFIGRKSNTARNRDACIDMFEEAERKCQEWNAENERAKN